MDGIAPPNTSQILNDSNKHFTCLASPGV